MPRAFLVVLAFCAQLIAISLARSDDFKIELQGEGGNCYGCEWIFLGGTIPPDAVARFNRYRVDNDLQDVVVDIHFDSTGGSVTGAMELGRLIRKEGARTFVGSSWPGLGEPPPKDGPPPYCKSACVFAFVGGATRTADGGQIGIHQISDAAYEEIRDDPVFSAKDLSDRERNNAIIIDYFKEMGVDTSLLSRMADTPPDGMSYLTKADLAAYNVTVDPLLLSEWHLTARSGALVVSAQTPANRTEVQIYCSTLPGWNVQIKTSQIDDYFVQGMKKHGIVVFGERTSRVSISPPDHGTVVISVVIPKRELPPPDTKHDPDYVIKFAGDPPQSDVRGYEGFGFNPQSFVENITLAKKSCVH